jgi:hypothetical protein
MAQIDFDASVVEPTTDFEAIPKGDYLAMVVDSEDKPTKSGDGKYLQLTLEILDGDHKGRRLWDRLNLWNKNETAVKIAQGSLSALCHAVGVLRPKDSAELHGKPVTIKVIVEERNDKPGVFKNEIKGYAAVGAASKAPATSAPAAASTRPPWKK